MIIVHPNCRVTLTKETKTMRTSLSSLYLIVGTAAVVVLTYFVTQNKFTQYQTRMADVDPEYASVKQVEESLDCLALNVYREAANEPFEGKVAVAQVTINRTKSGKFPDTVCAVVYERNMFMKKVVCQFSWYCNRTHRSRPIDQEKYQESYDVSKKVLLEGFKLDILNDALYYHADYVNPNWKFKRITKIGTHIFYKLR